MKNDENRGRQEGDGAFEDYLFALVCAVLAICVIGEAYAFFRLFS